MSRRGVRDDGAPLVPGTGGGGAGGQPATARVAHRRAQRDTQRELEPATVRHPEAQQKRIREREADAHLHGQHDGRHGGQRVLPRQERQRSGFLVEQQLRNEATRSTRDSGNTVA